MKLKLTEQAELELKVINARIDEDEEAYDNLNERDLLITDAMLYIEEAYIDNEFDDLKTWCRELGPTEYDQTYLNIHPDAVYNKVSEMLRLNIVEVV